MSDYDSKPTQKAVRKKKRKLRSAEDDDEEEERPSKGSRITHSKRDIKEPKEKAEQRQSSEMLENGPPWRNLQLILLLQNKDVDLQKKVKLAYDYVKLIVSDEVDDTRQDLETVSISRVIVFLNNWVQSLLISSEKKIRAEGNRPQSASTESCLDYRCWEIFKFCLEESLKLHVSLSISRDCLRVIQCIARDALSQLSGASSHPEVRDLVGKQFELYSTVLGCISLIFSSHGGVSNDNLDLWVLTVYTVLELVQKILIDKLDGGKVGIFVMQFSCVVLEPFTKFLRVHPTRKNGFHDFIDKLLEPLLHLLDVLCLYINSSNPGWTRNLLKLVEEVLSQGLFHPTHIDGFLSLQSTSKYKTSDDGKPKDLKTVIRSYHRHLFDKLEKIMAGNNALALGGLGELFRLYVDCIKKQKGVSVRGGGSRHLEDDLTGQIYKSSSRNSSVVPEKSHCSGDLNAETRKSLFDFFVQIIEPFLLEIDARLQGELDVRPVLLDVHCTLKSINKILFSFMHENVYIRTEDTSEGACLNFLKVVYDMIVSLSTKFKQLLLSTFGLDKGIDKEVLNLISKELIVAVRYLLEIEYEVVGNDLESLWLMMFSYGALGHSLMDLPDQSLLASEIIHLGCQLVNLYSELRQVNHSVFALCKAVRHLVFSVTDDQTCYSKRMSCTPSLYYESCAKSLSMVLCSQEFRLSIYNAMKSIPEGQASGCIRQLTKDISESLEWMKCNCSLAAGNELGKLDPNSWSSERFGLQAELLGRGLSEVYTLTLDSLTVTTGNSSLVGVSVKDLMAVIRPSMSKLIALQPDGVYEFLSTVMGRTFNTGAGCENEFMFTHWVFLFFFRLYMCCRSLQRRVISLVPPDTSIKMSGVMGDSFTAYSGRDWLERTGGTDEGYFSWIVQPSGPLLSVTQAVSDICLQGTVADCSPLVYVLIGMALQRLVDLNRLIKSFEYLVQRDDNVIHTKLTGDAALSLHRKKSRRWKRCVSDFRQEAAGLTNFMLGYLPVVAKDQLSVSSPDDAMYRDISARALPENNAWNFGVGAMNEKSLPSAIWWIICQNIDIWCIHAAKKKLKMFLSLLIRYSLPCVSSSLNDFENRGTTKPVNVKTVTIHQISFEVLSDAVLYEQRFVRRHMASRFCRILGKSISPIFNNFGAVDLSSPTDWPDVLTALENSSIVVSDNNGVVNNRSSGAEQISHSSNRLHMKYCKEQKFFPSVAVEFTVCQSLLQYFCWMPKGYLSSRAFSLYATCILNLERLVVGSLVDYHGALHLHDHYELFRLFTSCRSALKNLIMASCEEKMEASQSSLTPTLFESSFPVLWLLKSLAAVVELQHAFSDDGAVQVKDMIFSLMDHTSYVFLMLSKDQFIHALHFLIHTEKHCEEVPNFTVPCESSETEFDPCLNSSKDIDAWKGVVLVAETLREQTGILLISLKEAFCSRKVEVCAGVQDLKKLSSIISCFQGFLWGLASALDDIDVESGNLKAKLSRWKFEPIYKVNLCIDTFANFISYFLCVLFLEDDKLLQSLSYAQALPTSEGNDNLLGVKGSSGKDSGDVADILYGEEQQNSCIARNCSATSDIKDDSVKSVRKKRSRSGNAFADSILTEVDLFEQQCIKKSFLRGLLRGENLEVAFFLRQLFIASSAILRLNLGINCTSLSSSLIPTFIGISQVLLLEFANMVEAPHPFSFVLLDGIVKFLEELGRHFPLINPTLSRHVYVKLIDLHLRAIGKCISLQGKRASLASHETESSTKTLNGLMGLSESTLSHRPYSLDELKSRLRMSFKVFVEKPSELHLLSAIQAIERALVGVQEGCMINYEIHTGSSDGGRISSIVAAGIDCLDLVLEFVRGHKRLSLVKRHIQSLVACLFNIILHVQGQKIFHLNVIHNRGDADPDPGSVILMCVEVLTRVSGKHALFQMDTCHVAQSLRIPAALFQNFLQLRISEAPAQSNSLRLSDIEGTESVESMNTFIVDRQFSIDLFAACCRLLCTVLRHHKRESQLCVAILEDSVCVLLHCLEMVDVYPAAKKGYLSWEVQEGVKCACFLRRIYEEIRQQKDVLGQHCFQFLSNYIWVYSGYGPLKSGIRREVDEAMRPGVYALIDACSANDLQHIHTVFGEGPCRSTLATLQHDYKQNFQYEGKV